MISDKNSNLALGLDISNIGTQISYTENEDEFIPANFRLGAALTLDLDEYNSVCFAGDLNKLLVPTSPIYSTEDTTKILYGKDPDEAGPIEGMIQSFYDAPGKFREEMNEIMWSLGIEYWYQEQFAIRAGYFHEHATKGNRKYFTAGIGLRLNVFGIDFSYLIPATGRNHPLANTVRFTLLFDFGKT